MKRITAAILVAGLIGCTTATDPATQTATPRYVVEQTPPPPVARTAPPPVAQPVVEPTPTPPPPETPEQQMHRRMAELRAEGYTFPGERPNIGPKPTEATIRQFVDAHPPMEGFTVTDVYTMIPPSEHSVTESVTTPAGGEIEAELTGWRVKIDMITLRDQYGGTKRLTDPAELLFRPGEVIFLERYGREIKSRTKWPKR